jgi:prophage maintenance system killer protein
VALILTLEFLALNGATVEMENDALADMIVATAETDPAAHDDVVVGLAEQLRPTIIPLTEDL